MSENPKGIPPMSLHPLKLNRVLRETVAVSTVVVEDIPRLWSSKSAEILKRDQEIIQIILQDGFMEKPNVPRVVRSRRAELCFDPEATAYSVGSLTLIPTVSAPALSFWRQRLLAYIIRNSVQAMALFGTPPDRVIMLGRQIKL
jgi:KUP system potassium uptake protein